MGASITFYGGAPTDQVLKGGTANILITAEARNDRRVSPIRGRQTGTSGSFQETVSN
jgi:hypothetical protein